MRVARAVMLAAGRGRRLGGDMGAKPKCLLRIGNQTLLERHVRTLARYGIQELVVAVGFRAECVVYALSALATEIRIQVVPNPQYEHGSIVTLRHLSKVLTRGGDVLLMDADVLYDERLLAPLLRCTHPNCLLLDREYEAGEEPLKAGIRDGAPVELRKRIRGNFDLVGESVGFYRFSDAWARRLARRATSYVEAGRLSEPYEESVRDLLREAPPGTFGYEDITGLPWIEIDFAEDVSRAKRDILPRLRG